jgi:hypothetical protein
MPVVAGGSTWEIAAVPSGSLASAQTDILVLRIASLAAF